MRKRPWVWKIAAALLIVGAVAWLFSHFSEPKYLGKPLSVWLDEAWTNGDVLAYVEGDRQPDTSSARAVRAIGAAGLPTLNGMIQARDSPFGEWLDRISDRYTWLGIHRRPANELQAEAVYGYAVLGPAAKSAVPDLARLLTSDDLWTREAAAYRLGLIGEAGAGAVPDLARYLDAIVGRAQKNSGGDWDAEVRCAMFALGEIGPAARSAVPRIATLAGTNVWAKAALINITGSGLDAAIEPLKDVSNRTNWLFATFVVRSLGSRAAPAVPWLIADLQQNDEQIQGHVFEALGEIHAHPEQCIPALLPFLRSTNNSIRLRSLETISVFGGSAAPWAPSSEIVRCLADPDAKIRRAATNTLRRVAPDAAAKAGL